MAEDWLLPPGQPDTQSNTAFDYLTGFGKSALSSIPELIGFNPSEDTAQWRQDNPVGGFLSEFAGSAVPYIGWFKAAKYIKPLANVAENLAKIKNPLLAGAASTAATLAPFEAGRVAANQAVGEQTFGSMLGSAASDLALGAGIGGVLHGIAAVGTRDTKLPSIFPGLDISLPPSLMARKMSEIINSGAITDPEMRGKAMFKLKETLRAARTEDVSGNVKYVGPLGHDASPSGSNPTELQRELNRLFRVKDDPGDRTLQSRMFATGDKRNFHSEALWKAEAKEAGLPDDFIDKGQFYRTVQFGKHPEKGEAAGKKVAEGVDQQLTKNMESVGDGNFLTREADDGMFIIARKYNGDAGTGKITDKWLLFKTDQPGQFLPDADKWVKYQTHLASWVPNAELAKDAGPVYNTLVGYTKEFPLRNYRALATDPAGVAKAVGFLLPQNLAGKSNELINRFGEATREYLAPRIFQFKKSWRANWIVNATKTAYDRAEMLVNEMMHGSAKLDTGKGLFMQSLSKLPVSETARGIKPIQQMTEGLSKEDLLAFHKIWNEGIHPDDLHAMMLSGDLSAETMKFAQNLDLAYTTTMKDVNAVEKATGRKETKIDRTTYGMPRMWEGDTRILLKNDSGEVVGMAAGATRGQAQKAAQHLLVKNPAWHQGDTLSLSQTNWDQLEKTLKDHDISAKLLNPSFKIERQDIAGYKWHMEPFTKEGFIEDYENALRGQHKYQANIAANDVMAPHLDRLSREDPAAHRMVTARMNDYAGVPAYFGKWQNRLADRILAPMLGINSATKIVAATNTAMFDLQLGMLRLAYPVENALQFVQTVVPETAFVLGKAVEADKAGYYSHFAAGGTAGPVGGMAVLSPLKLMSSSLKEMRNPPPQTRRLFERMVNDRGIDPKIVEEFFGESATKVSDLRGVLKGDASFPGWLRAVSEFLPAASERMSRSHAFTVGIQIARDFLKTKAGEALNEEQIYHFAKQFTERTMFMYGTSDKARVFTTPAGSLMGLFKNWMFHYLGSMAEYTGQAAKGNWAPLLWQTGGTAAIGGLAATPVYAAANGFSKLFSNKSALSQTYDMWGEGADSIMYGLPALMGISMTQGVDVPALSNPVRDAGSLFSLAAWSRVQAASKAVGAAFDNWQATGRHPGTDPASREFLIRAFAPTTMYRALGAIEPDQITSLGTGYPQVKNVSLPHRLLYTFGFNPIELQRGQDVSQEIFETHQTLKKQEEKLGKAWAQAEMEGQSGQMALIMRQGMVWGVDISKVIKNGMQEIERHRKDLIERAMRPQDLPKYKRIMALQKGEEE